MSNNGKLRCIQQEQRTGMTSSFLRSYSSPLMRPVEDLRPPRRAAPGTLREYTTVRSDTFRFFLVDGGNDRRSIGCYLDLQGYKANCLFVPLRIYSNAALNTQYMTNE
jgi:hypothetical protein